MERTYLYTMQAPEPPARRAAPARRPSRTAAKADADRDSLLLGGGLALLTVAASSALLLAQVTRLQRELGAR